MIAANPGINAAPVTPCSCEACTALEWLMSPMYNFDLTAVNHYEMCLRSYQFHGVMDDDYEAIDRCSSKTNLFGGITDQAMAEYLGLAPKQG